MKPTDAQKHQFYSEMAKLLEAGFGVREAAQVMTENGLPAAQAALIRDMNDGLANGKSITDAFGSNPETVSALERNIIGAGERGGRMPTAMRHLSDYFEMLASVRREVLKGLVHPIIVLHLGVFVGTVPTAMVQGQKSTGQIATTFGLTLLATYAGAFLLFLGIRALLRAARTHAGIDGWLRRVPLVGKTRNNLAMAAFCKVYHTCLLAGLPMRDTVRMAADASQSGMLIGAGKRLEQSVSEGNPIGPRMMVEASIPKAFSRSYSTGEAAGTLDKDLQHWGNLFQKDARDGARMLAGAIPKGLYFLVMIFVAWKIVGFYSAQYEIFDKLE